MRNLLEEEFRLDKAAIKDQQQALGDIISECNPKVVDNMVVMAIAGGNGFATAAQ
jgi:hypothetical protein